MAPKARPASRGTAAKSPLLAAGMEAAKSSSTADLKALAVPKEAGAAAGAAAAKAEAKAVPGKPLKEVGAAVVGSGSSAAPEAAAATAAAAGAAAKSGASGLDLDALRASLASSKQVGGGGGGGSAPRKADGSMDLDAIRASLAGPKAAPPPPAKAAPAADLGPLSPFAWSDEITKLGPEGAAKEAGAWLRDRWKDVSAELVEQCGALGPDRLRELEGLEEKAKPDIDIVRVSALHCGFALIFWAHQNAISFTPQMNLTAAGQKGNNSAAEALFQNMLNALSIARQIARDIDTRRCQGPQPISTSARKVANELKEHVQPLKTYINNRMADSIGLSTGGG